jgi:hypothetical protein
MPHHEPAVEATIGPDGQPSRFDGAAWVSHDGRYFWNGAAWQPIARPSRRPSGLVIVLGVVVVAIGGFILFNALTRPWEGEGVSNARIDSRTAIEFDYQRASHCNNLTFVYKFFDSRGNQVQVLSDTKGSPVDGSARFFGKTYHVTVSFNPQQPISSSAMRFEADATCHD